MKKTDRIWELDALRVRFLGKKGELTAVLKQMGKLSAEERPVIGQLANDVRAKLEANIEEKTKELADKAMELKLKSEAVDVTIPGKQEKIGVKHPMYQVLDEIKDIFVGMGFEILEDREVELAEYNFTKLNVEEGHPAPRVERHVLFHRGQLDPSAHADLSDADPRDGDARAAHPHSRPRPRVP